MVDRRAYSSVRICGVLPSLAAGGAERVMSLLVNHWARRGWRPVLVTLSSGNGDAYRLDPTVERVALGLAMQSASTFEGLARNATRVARLRKTFREVGPHVIVSFGDQMNVITLLSSWGLGRPVVVSLRTVPSHFPIGWIWSMLRRLMYPSADAVVVQTPAMQTWAQRFVPATRLSVIPNVVGEQFVARQDADVPRRRLVLGVGRLGHEKGFDILLRAFAAVWPEHRDWSVRIAGAGPLEFELKELASALLPAGVTNFVGAVRNPEDHYREAGLFVLPSRFEGFPNALLEAMACGSPVIAADCPVGPGAIIHHGVDGKLVPPDDVPALASELRGLMSNAEERNRLGQRAGAAAQRFRIDQVAPLWDELLAKVIERRR